MRTLAIALLLALAGCATYSTVLTDGNGHAYRCVSWGNGIVGMIEAKHIHDDCLRDMMAVGYHPVTPTPQ